MSGNVNMDMFGTPLQKLFSLMQLTLVIAGLMGLVLLLWLLFRALMPKKGQTRRGRKGK
ncbi:hypothetical protein SAMN06272783_4921 [Serratia sp. JKS296]|nr:hypothetical protein SAMN06272783_4921 [Serratia sp. JKS296]